MNEPTNDFWADAEIIDAYTRKQAIEDGVLVDLSQGDFGKLCREAGFKIPLAMTATAFGACVGGLDGEPLPTGQDQAGRLWDVLMLLRHAIRKSGGDTDRVYFTVGVWDGRRSVPVKLWSLCGPGDAAEPVITVMLEGED
jgi:hypothetical protein